MNKLLIAAVLAATSKEAEQLIPQGWKFIGTLPNGKVVLEYARYAISQSG